MALLTTQELAQQLYVKPQSIIAHYCRRKSYFGVIPEKLPNGRLLWPADSLERMKARKEGIVPPPSPAVDFLADLVANRGVEIAASQHVEPFEQLTAHMVAPCGTKIHIDAEHFDMSHVTTALVAQGWIVTLLQRAE